MVYPITRYSIFPFFRKLSKQVLGLENLPEKAPFIVASNHITQIDPLPIIALLFQKYKTKVRYITNSAHHKKWYHKISESWAGCIIMDKNNKANVIEKAVYHLETGRDIVGIFPEGRRNSNKKSTRVTKGKTGVARIAHRTGFPVLPIGISANPEPHRIRDNGEEYSSLIDIINKNTAKYSNIKLNIGRPIVFKKISSQELDYKTIRTSTDIIMREIASLCKRSYIP